MPRTARIVVPNTPHHIIQRGHNKQSVFFNADDYEAYLCVFRKWTTEFGVKVYAYCLMTNHVHFVLDPGPDVHSLAKTMKRVSGKATRRINRIHNRSGTLWESRYKSSPIQTDEYLLACCRYIDLNPVTAGMVAHPGAYRWSSFRQKTSPSSSNWVNLDDCYKALGDTADKRMRSYAKFVVEGLAADGEIELIRRAVNFGQLTGNDQFSNDVEKATGKRTRRRRPGRPSTGRKKK